MKQNKTKRLILTGWANTLAATPKDCEKLIEAIKQILSR